MGNAEHRILMRRKTRKAARAAKRGRLIRRIAGEEGTAAIEFALTIPLILSLLFGILDFSRMTFSQAALNFAAEEATRYAVVREGVVSDDDIKTFAEQTLVDVFGLDGAIFTVNTDPDPVTGTSVITVTGAHDFSFLLPFLPTGLIQLTSESRGFLAFPAGAPGGVGG